MLWAMNIEREIDMNGNPVPMDVDGCVEDGLAVYVVSCAKLGFQAHFIG